VAWAAAVEVRWWPAIGASGATRPRTSCIPVAVAIVVADAAADCTIASAAWGGRHQRRPRRQLQRRPRDGGCR